MTASERPRVVQVTWRLSRGGGKTQVGRDLVLHHDPGAVDLHTVSMRPLLEEDDLEPLRRVSTLHSLDVTTAGMRAGGLRTMPALDRMVSGLDPRVLHLHAGWDWWLVPLLARRPRLAALVEVHDPPGTGKATAKHARFLRLLSRRPGVRFLAHSAWTRERTAEALRLPPAAIDLVPLGIALPPRPTDGQRRDARIQLGIPDGRKVVLYVARLVPTKRPLLFLDVARRILADRTDVEFVLVGHGRLDGEVRARLGDLGPRFRYLGYVDDLGAVQAAADVFLSTSAYEGFGLGVAEAMAAGAVPVAASRAGGLADVVGDAGRMVDDDGVEGLSAALVDLLDDPTGRARLREVGMARVRERFAVERSVRGIQDLWLELATTRSGPAPGRT